MSGLLLTLDRAHTHKHTVSVRRAKLQSINDSKAESFGKARELREKEDAYKDGKQRRESSLSVDYSVNNQPAKNITSQCTIQAYS